MLLGGVQGTIIGQLGINSLVFTIGSLILLRGLTHIFSNSAPIMIENFEITDPLLERYGIFSLSSIIAIVVFALTGLFLTYTRWGREIFAIGGARNEAIAAGVPRVRPFTVAFAISGGCASLAGALAAARGGSAAPQNYEDLLLAGCAAALLGGVSLYGGRGTVFNVALGVAILSVVAAGLAARGSEASLVQLVTGRAAVYRDRAGVHRRAQAVARDRLWTRSGAAFGLDAIGAGIFDRNGRNGAHARTA